MPLKIGDPCPMLQVFDMPVSIAFYRDLLGFTVASDVPGDLEDPDGYVTCFQQPAGG